jgi:ATP-dependent Clp protease adaptor protein ClpS
MTIVAPETEIEDGEVGTITKKQTSRQAQPPYNVILHNDDDHSFEYVIAMLRQVFGYLPERGMQLAKAVHEQGKVVVWTGWKEVAELKQELIHGYGPDPMIPRCKGSMTATIEPAR